MTKKTELYLYLFFFLGLLISIYAYHVETSFEKSSSYKAFCDIGPKMSCSKVLTSKYSKGFGLIGKVLGKDSIFNVPNCLYGIIFYSILSGLYFFKPKGYNTIGLISATVANFGTLYLAYILAFILHDLCLVCIATYIVNGFILYFTIKHHRNQPKSNKAKLI